MRFATSAPTAAAWSAPRCSATGETSLAVTLHPRPASQIVRSLAAADVEGASWVELGCGGNEVSVGGPAPDLVARGVARIPKCLAEHARSNRSRPARSVRRDGVTRLLLDQIGVDGGGGPDARVGSPGHPRHDVGHVACDPDARDGGSSAEHPGARREAWHDRQGL